MKTAVVFYFSGTGNTQLVANMVQDGLNDLECDTDLIRIEDVLKSKTMPDLSKYELIGIGSQVIGFTTPRIVDEFIRKLPKTNEKKVFVFRTAGGVAPVNYNASKKMIRRLQRKGYDVYYERLFSIGSNWINRFEDAIMGGLYEATKRKVTLMCQEVSRGEKRLYPVKTMQAIGMGMVSACSSFVWRLVGKDFAVTESCKHCGLCTQNCPAQNICEKNGKMRFGFSCNACMRCVYSCPQNAIRLRKFKFFAVEGGYDIRKILERSRMAKEAVKKPAFFDEYVANDAL